MEKKGKKGASCARADEREKKQRLTFVAPQVSWWWPWKKKKMGTHPAGSIKVCVPARKVIFLSPLPFLSSPAGKMRLRCFWQEKKKVGGVATP